MSLTPCLRIRISQVEALWIVLHCHLKRRAGCDSSHFDWQTGCFVDRYADEKTGCPNETPCQEESNTPQGGISTMVIYLTA
jgi:hypothetical protein